MNSFQKYVQFKESVESAPGEGNDALGSKVSLGDGNEFKPFVVSDDPKSENYGQNKNLAPIIRAFKNGANWGWSKDESGKDKPVKIPSKKLYLSGGAVRDHLVGRKPRNVELSTNASPDEIYQILKQNGFDYLGKRNSDDKVSPNKKHNSTQIFWSMKTNQSGRPYSFGIKVNENEYELDVFQKGSRGFAGKEPQSGAHSEDASDRDFTLNSMYIALSNDNGPNKELLDFYGGIHDLASKKIKVIGDIDSKLNEDPSKLLRLARMVTCYGNPSKISEEEKACIRKAAPGLQNLDRKYMMDEFKKGLDKEDVDCRSYLNVHQDLGLLDKIFPNKFLDTDLPKELSELGDKQMPLAWMLRMNRPADLADVGLDHSDLKKVIFLIKSLNIQPDIDGDNLIDLLNGYMTSGVSGRKLRDWGVKLGNIDGGVLDAFINHAKSPRVKVFIQQADGTTKIAEEFSDLVDAFKGAPAELVNERKKEIELRNFKKLLNN